MNECYRSVADRFNMGKSSLHDSFCRVVNVLNDIAGSVIVWPRRDRLITVKTRFSEIGVLPDVIGAIDGSHIPILAPQVRLFYLCTILITFSLILVTQLILFLCSCPSSFIRNHTEPGNPYMLLLYKLSVMQI